MSLIPSFHGRRVPLYIWLPIVLACAAVGFLASTLRPIRGMPSPRSEMPDQARVLASVAGHRQMPERKAPALYRSPSPVQSHGE